jgi:hypothetical protein
LIPFKCSIFIGDGINPRARESSVYAGSVAIPFWRLLTCSRNAGFIGAAFGFSPSANTKLPPKIIRYIEAITDRRPVL